MTPTFVVVPTIGTDGHILSLVRELRHQAVTGVCVVDNGMDGDLQADVMSVLRQTGGRMIEDPTKNLHRLWNRGLDWCQTQATFCNVAVLNDDIVLEAGAIEAMASALRSAPDIAVAGCRYDDRPGAGIVDVRGIQAGLEDGTGGMPGWAFMLRGEHLYRFPEDMHWFFGDNDLMTRCDTYGYRTVLNLDRTIRHIDGGSNSLGPEQHARYQADGEAFITRWARAGVNIQLQGADQ